VWMPLIDRRMANPTKVSCILAHQAPALSGGKGELFSAWGASDVLKNDGDTVSVKLGATVVDSVTYPAFSNLVAGRALAFPSDCPAAVRNDWTRWSLTFDAYSAGFEGTPNATNDDVACY